MTYKITIGFTIVLQGIKLPRILPKIQTAITNIKTAGLKIAVATTICK